MIDLIFFYGTEVVFIRIKGSDVRFSTNAYKQWYGSIENLKLSYAGVCREFPDLELNENWRAEAIKRFKEKLKSFKSEEEIASYLISDLKEHGYIAKFKQKAGFRREVL